MDNPTLNENIFPSGIVTANVPDFNYTVFVNTINQSPTLVNSLNLLGPGKIVLGEISNTGGAIYSNGIITIDPDSLSSPTIIGLLAHELGHVAQGSSNTKFSPGDAVDSGLTNEASATLLEYRIIKQLQEKGVLVTMHTGAGAPVTLISQLDNLVQNSANPNDLIEKIKDEFPSYKPSNVPQLTYDKYYAAEWIIAHSTLARGLINYSSLQNNKISYNGNSYDIEVVLSDGSVQKIHGELNGKFVTLTKEIDFTGDGSFDQTIQYTREIHNVDAEAVGNSLGTISGAVHVDRGSGSDDAVSLLDPSATLTADGINYLLSDVIDGLSAAADAAAEFVASLVNQGLDWFASPTGAQTSFASWLAGNIGDLIDGNISAEDAIIGLAQQLGQDFIADFISSSVTDVLGAKSVIQQVLREDFGINDIAVVGVGPNGQIQTEASLYADAIYSALGRIALDFVLNGFDAEQALKAGLGTIAGSITATYMEINGFSAAKSAAAVAAITTAITGILDSGDFDSADWAQLGVQVGLAAGSAYAGVAIANALVGAGAATANPVAIVAGAIVGLIGSKLFGGLFGGKKFGPGEFPTAEQAWNSVFQVQDIVVNGETVKALVAVNASGSTILASGTGIGYVLGNNGSDVLVGDEGKQTIDGKNGADYVESRGGDDALLGGAGNDHLNAGAGKDILQGDAGDDILFGEAGEDTLAGGADDDFMHLGSGADIASGGAGRDYVLGSTGDDAISGDDNQDMIDGGGDNDTITAGDGDDLVIGNLGNDLINGEAGSDTLFGDAGLDQIYGGDANDYIDGGAGNDMLHGENGDDTIVAGADTDSLDGDDFVDGGLGDDDIWGGLGNDRLLGNMDDDYLKGELGNDSIEGGFGNDILIGNEGENNLQGGEGDDVYVIGEDLAEFGNIISDSASGTVGDTLLVDWISEFEANDDLELLKDGDDLKISYDGRLLATVTDHFVAGKALERVELGSDKYIDLSTVSYDSGTGLGTFNIEDVEEYSAAGTVLNREIDMLGDGLAKPLFWNQTFFDKLSDLAYEEQLQETYDYYNGSEIDEVFRRGKFTGKYSVYTIAQNGQIDGTEYKLEYVVKDPQDQAAASAFGNNTTGISGPYDGADLDATVIYSTHNGKHFQDILIDGTVVSTKVAGDPTNYAPGATAHGASFAHRQAIGTSDLTKVVTKEMGGDMLVGSYVAETINGKSGKDMLAGNDGNDSLIGGADDDWIFGGDGNDTVQGDEGGDVIFGGDGNDNMVGGLGNDAMLGSGGNDLMHGNEGDDWIDGGAENDTINGHADNDVLLGGDGNDSISGDAGDDVLQGGDGNDTLSGGAGDDTLISGSGVDILSGGTGTDLIQDSGGQDSDLVNYVASTAAVNVNLETNINTGGDAAGDELYKIERLWGSNHNDTLTGSAQNEVINGAAGNDTLNGGGGDDVLWAADNINGAAGSDALNGGDGVDVASYEAATAAVAMNFTANLFSGQAAGDSFTNIEGVIATAYSDTISGGGAGESFYGRAGNDILNGVGGNDILVGGAGNDTLDGGADHDIISYYDSAAAVTVYLGNYGGVAGAIHASGGDAAGDTFSNVEGVTGSAHGDLLVGTTSANTFQGLAGNDTIAAMGGADTLDGGEGLDIASYMTVTSAVGINLDTNTHTGAAAGSNITNFETIWGSAYNDTIVGSAANESFAGNAGNDNLAGGDGNDTLAGGAGADTLNGGMGIDAADYNTSTSAVSINLATSSFSGGDAAGDNLSNIEMIFGSGYNDTLVGAAAWEYLAGGNGNDSIAGGDGNDQIAGGAGTDTLDGGSGSGDMVDYYSSTAAVTVFLSNNYTNGGDATGDSITNFENVAGSNGYGDNLAGNSSVNALYGYGGNDTLTGGAGADILHGGDGIDTASYVSATSAISINLTSNVNTGAEAQGDALTSIEAVTGSAHADTLTGAAAAENLVGNDGNDYLEGRGGADTLSGGNGFDFAIYSASSVGVTVNLALATAQSGGEAAGDILSGIEGVVGSDYSDVLYGSSAANTLLAGKGNDTIFADAGADYYDGGDGWDYLMYTSATAGISINLTGANSGDIAAGDTITGTIECIIGSSYNDTIVGSAAAQWLYGGSGNDSIMGMDGDDVLGSGLGNDTLNGGNGIDYVNYDGSDAVYVNLGTGVYNGGHATGDTLSNIENIYGSTNNDTILGDAINNYLAGFVGNDILTGGVGNDTLHGGDGVDRADYSSSAAAVAINLKTNTYEGDAAGDSLISIEGIVGTAHNDTITGNDGNNSLWGGSGNDSLHGEAGDDTIFSGAGSDTVDGGDGFDIISYETNAAAVSVNLTSGTHTGTEAVGDVLSHIEGIIGTSYNDTLTGDTADNLLSGAAGNDSLVGGDGNDTLQGGSGVDILNGGNGSDTVDYANSGAGIYVILLNGDSGQNGDAQGDIYQGIENITGSAHDDTLAGDTGNNILKGGAGNDFINAYQGNDTIYGGDGNDQFFFWNTHGADVIMDFQGEGVSGGDVISLYQVGYTAFTSQFQSLITYNDTAQSATINFSVGNTITIYGISQPLSAADFAFTS